MNHPGADSGHARRRDRLAGERGQRVLDLLHSHRTVLPDKEVVDEALGEDFAGALVSDFYAAYHHYDGPKQRCWDLLREIHDLRALYSR